MLKISPEFNKQTKVTQDAFWPNSAKNFIKSLILADNEIRKKKKENINNIFSLFQKEANLIFSNKEKTYFRKLKKVVDKMVSISFEMEGGNNGDAKQIFNNINDFIIKNNITKIEFWGYTAKETFSSIIGHVQTFLGEWTDPVIDNILWSDPFTKSKKQLSIKESIINKKILIYSIPPANLSESYYRLGKILKNKFFTFSFLTYEKRKKEKIPIFYIADEFHRFITGDEETGEQSFLDRCRAYDVSCILATQSVSSLKYGLKENTNTNEDVALALEIILVNCGTKFFFRTTDKNTQETLKALIPESPYTFSGNLKHVVDVYPIAMLDVGECYYFTPVGDWGRTKITIPSTY